MAVVKAVITIEAKESPEVAKLVKDLFKTLKTVLKTEDIVAIGISEKGQLACKGAAFAYSVAKVDPDPELPFEPVKTEEEPVTDDVLKLAEGKTQDCEEAEFEEVEDDAD